LNTQIVIANGMLTELRAANPTLDPSRFRLAHQVRVTSVEELYRLIPPASGKQVWVIPLESGSVARASRSEDRNSYTMGVIAVERIDLASEYLLNPDHADQLNLWINDRIEWVKDKIRIPLHAPGFAPTTGAYSELWFMNELVDHDLLLEHGIFWSDLDFVYEIDEANE
jgi:hypothetical protein